MGKAEKEGKDRNAPSKNECRQRALEAGAGEQGAQRCDQSGSTGNTKPHEMKSKKDQEELVKNVFEMDDDTHFGEEES